MVPSKQYTGLFFLSDRPAALFAVIALDYGSAYVDSLHKGLAYAIVISQASYNTFVLKYNLGLGDQMATEDGPPRRTSSTDKPRCRELSVSMTLQLSSRHWPYVFSLQKHH